VRVNVGTVSRALNDKPGVSPDLRKKIVRKAADLGYRPNGHARGLVTQRTETIGLLSGVETSAFLSNPFYAGVFAGIEAETREHNHALMFASTTAEHAISSGRLPKFIAEHRVDGVLVVGAVDPGVVALLTSYRCPFVMVDYHVPDEGMDPKAIGRKAAQRLLQKLAEGSASTSRQVVLSADLVIRQATAVPRTHW
jgi:LacI family transcriptional regulator